MKILNIIFVILLSLSLHGCITAVLLTGTVVGGVYVADDINENYNGDGAEYIKDKTNKAYEAVTE